MLISLGFITYVEHGERRPNVLPSTLEAFHLEKVLSVALTANCGRGGTVALLTAVPGISLVFGKKKKLLQQLHFIALALLLCFSVAEEARWRL